jgi:hypothetical protein
VPAENDFMNDVFRSAAGKPRISVAELDAEPAPSGFSGSREFTVQAPGVAAPDDQFVYEPLPDTPGAWAVYPPGVPCETSIARISRATPAGVADFPKMQQALDDAGGGDALPPLDELSGTAPPDEEESDGY